MRNDVKFVPFGVRLQEIMDVMGYTQEEFAQIMGVSRRTIERYLLSQYCPNGQFLFKLWKETGENMEYLMGIGD